MVHDRSHLCFDQIYSINRVGMPVMNAKNDLWLPTFLIRYCFAFLMMRGREVTCRYAIFSALLLLQSDHSTEFCRGTAGNLNDELHSFIHAVFRSRF